jgi:hypothetical protein
MEEMHSLPVHPACKDVFMVLLVLDPIVSLSDANIRIVKAMDELQDFISKVCNNTLKQRSTVSYFKKQ